MLLQSQELNTLDHMVSQMTDAQVIGILVGIVLIVCLGVVMAILQQRNLGKLTEMFAGLLGSISARLQDAQDTKTVLTTVIDNQATILDSQATILTSQEDQGKLLMALPELVTLVNEALTLLRETVAQAKETALTTGQQTTEGFGRVEERFDTVDMQNGKILAELVKLNANIQRWIDGQQQGTAAQMKEQRKLNDQLLTTLRLMQESLERGTQENPVVKLEPENDSDTGQEEDSNG